MGDVHPIGNPHYWLDPENGKVIARTLAAKLSATRPNDKAYFDQRLADFTSRLTEAQKRWMSMMAPYKGIKVVTYHRSYTNFADRFGLDVIGYVEPRPGIPPTPQHTLDLVNEMQRQNVKIVLVEPVLRSQDAKCHRPAGRRASAGAAAVGRRHQGSVRLFQVVRLRHHTAGECHQAERSRIGWNSAWIQVLAAPFVASLILPACGGPLDLRLRAAPSPLTDLRGRPVVSSSRRRRASLHGLLHADLEAGLDSRP